MSKLIESCCVCNRPITICNKHQYCVIKCKKHFTPLYKCLLNNSIDPYENSYSKHKVKEMQVKINIFRETHENYVKHKQL